MNLPTIEEVRERFLEDRYATWLGITIDEISDNFAKCSLIIQDHHLNAANIVMGGVIFTLADFTFAVAANWNSALTVSLSSQITFLTSSKCCKLNCSARLIKEGHTTCYYIVDVMDDCGEIIASCTMNGFIKG